MGNETRRDLAEAANRAILAKSAGSDLKLYGGKKTAVNNRSSEPAQSLGLRFGNPDDPTPQKSDLTSRFASFPPRPERSHRLARARWTPATPIRVAPVPPIIELVPIFPAGVS